MGIELSKPALDVAIVTTNLERMMAFYQQVLGLEPSGEPAVFPGLGTIHRLAVGESLLRLIEPEQPPVEPSGTTDSVLSTTGYRSITLVMKNLDAVIEACRQFGLEVTRPPTEVRPGVMMTTIQDPDGNWIEMQSRG